MRVWLMVFFLIVMIIVYIPIPYKINGAPILRDKPCFLLFNHPFPYVDVSFADKFIRKQNLNKTAYVVVKYPHSIAHSAYVLPLSGATHTLPVKRKGNTLKMIQKIKNNHTVAAFYGRMQEGTGVFWAVLQTKVPFFTVRIEKNVFNIEPIYYDENTTVDDLRSIVRYRFGYEKYWRS